MSSLRSHEGYLLLDNRNNSGVPDELMQQQGFPVGAGRGVFECPTFTCRHCQRVVVINPDRSRERAYCRGCDHLLCDACGAQRAKTGKCQTFEQVIDEILTAAAAASTVKEF